MAYPSVPAPYGLKPVNLIGGQVFAGATRNFPIANGSATAIYNGDAVKIQSDGTVTKDTGTATASPVGVFVGCYYTNPSTNQRIWQQYYPGGVTSPVLPAGDITAVVVEDPDTVFKVAAVTSGTTMTAIGQYAIGLNAALVQNTGSTITGDSAVAINGVTTTLSLPVRIIQGVPDTALSASQTATTNSTTVVTLSAANANIYVGMQVYGTGIPAGAYVASVSGTTVNLSAAATTSTTQTLTFAGFTELLCKWNFGTHQYLQATGV